MGNDIAIPMASRYAEAALEVFTDSLDSIEDLMAHSKAPNTLRGYASDWRMFSRWARGRGLAIPDPFDGEAVPPAVLLAYLAESQDTRKVKTLERHMCAVRFYHHEHGLASPTDHPSVRKVLAGLSRKHGQTPDRAQPLFLDDLRAGLPEGDDEQAVRDRAILLVSWWGALRRSELVALTLADVEDHPQGVVLHLRRSKTDQAGAGAQIPLHYRQDERVCPVRALRAWIRVSGVEVGRIFPVSGITVARVAKRAAARVGFDPGRYSAHSLRAGFVSECDRRRISSGAVRVVTRHQSESMLAIYQRPGSLFEGSAGAFFTE